MNHQQRRNLVEGYPLLYIYDIKNRFNNCLVWKDENIFIKISIHKKINLIYYYGIKNYIHFLQSRTSNFCMINLLTESNRVWNTKVCILNFLIVYKNNKFKHYDN